MEDASYLKSHERAEQIAAHAAPRFEIARADSSDTGFAASARFRRRSVSSSVRPFRMTHYILDVEVGNTSVVVSLDTGARYEVAPDDIPTAACWYGSQQAQVTPSGSKVFSVRLYNESTYQHVEARRIVEADGKSDS